MDKNQKIKKKDEKSIIEEFTFGGFVILSFYIVQALPCYYLFQIVCDYFFQIEIENSWRNLGIAYLFCWIILFFILCLFPKIEERRNLD